MKKAAVLFVAAMIAMSAMAQHHHGHNPHQPVVEERHHHDHHPDQHPDHRQAPMPPCATPEQMQMVLQTLKAQSFDDKKLEIARLCVTIGLFCTDDLALMASEFSFDDNRLAFLEYAYPYCTDRERYPVLRECFAFRSNYDKLMETIFGR